MTANASRIPLPSLATSLHQRWPAFASRATLAAARPPIYRCGMAAERQRSEQRTRLATDAAAAASVEAHATASCTGYEDGGDNAAFLGYLTLTDEDRGVGRRAPSARVVVKDSAGGGGVAPAPPHEGSSLALSAVATWARQPPNVEACACARLSFAAAARTFDHVLNVHRPPDVIGAPCLVLSGFFMVGGRRWRTARLLRELASVGGRGREGEGHAAWRWQS